MSGLRSLRNVVTALPRAAVAVSGGVDSMTLAFLAGRWLGPRAEMLHAVSPAVPAAATARVEAHAARHGWRLRLIDAGEFADPDYLSNPVNRCYFCKRNLYAAIDAAVAGAGNAVMLSGANTDDLGDYRPGLDAAREAAVRHPYIEAGIDKPTIRIIARRFGLADLHALPAAPCLASRLQTGLAVTGARLAFVAEAEQVLQQRWPQAQSLRCRLLHDRVEIQLDPELATTLDPTGRRRLLDDIAVLARDHAVALPVALTGYRRGSAFIHPPGAGHA